MKRLAGAIALLAILVIGGNPALVVQADDLFVYNQNTGHYVRGDYLRYYLSHGGPAVLGDPRTEDFREGDRTVQYFQNVRLEWDCGSDGKGPCVLRPGLLGEQISGIKVDLPPDRLGSGQASNGAISFPETNTAVEPPFTATFVKLGGLEFFGYPLTDSVEEAGQTVQWFQRARLQIDLDGVVRLSPLGDYWIDTLRKVPAPLLVRRPEPATAPPVLLTAPRNEGRFVYQTKLGGQIAIINADGTGQQDLADGSEPALSPDGTLVAFNRAGATPGIYVLDLATGEETLVFSGNRVRSPSWSPDGSKIAFLRSKQDPVLGFDPATRRPKWTLEDHFSIAVIPAGGGDVIDLPSQEFSSHPSWSPDGKQIVFDGNTGLYIVDATGASGPKLIPGTNGVYTQPAWSPDGSLIAFAYKRADHYDIAVIRPAGGGVRLLTNFENYTRASNNVAPTWSPDGSKVAFLSDREGSWNLYTVDLDGTNVQPVFAGDQPLTFEWADERVVSWGR